MSDLSLTVTLEFKSQREKDEFYQVSPRIQALALLSAFTMEKLWSYRAVVTSIHRTQAEQDALRKSGAPAVAHSPHTDWRALDIRLNDFPHKEHLPVLRQIINSEFPRSDGYVTGLIHGEGGGVHLHLQVPTTKRF